MSPAVGEQPHQTPPSMAQAPGFSFPINPAVPHHSTLTRGCVQVLGVCSLYNVGAVFKTKKQQIMLRVCSSACRKITAWACHPRWPRRKTSCLSRLLRPSEADPLILCPTQTGLTSIHPHLHPHPHPSLCSHCWPSPLPTTASSAFGFSPRDTSVGNLPGALRHPSQHCFLTNCKPLRV